MLFAAALASACMACSAPPTDAQITAAVDRLAAEAVSTGGTAGLSIAVARDGRLILSKGYGLAEVEHDVAATADTMFRAGSITKQFTAAAIMRLVEQGKVGLDEPVTTHLPGYNTHGREITIRHLLTHTSGIKSYTDLVEIMREAPERVFTHHELIGRVQNEPLAFEPGTQFAYNNTGYYLLGMIIEKVSGKDYAAYLRDEFFVPLGLTRTRCDANAEIIKGRAQGYAMEGDTLINDRGLATSTPFAAGALIASAHDLVVWAEALAAGRVVSPASYKAMSTPFPLVGGGANDYGFGLIIDALDGHARVQHGGNIFGFSAMLARFPDDGVTVAVLSNTQSFSAARLAQALSREALGLADPYAAAAVSLSEADAAKCVGVYEFPGQGWGFTITRRDGKMFAKASDDAESAMTYAGKGEFRVVMYDKDARLVFDLTGDGPAPAVVLHEGGAALTAKRK